MLGQQERPQIWQKTVLTWLNRDPVASVPMPVIVNTCSFKTPGFFRTQVSYRWERKHFRAVQKVIKPRRFQVHKIRGGGPVKRCCFSERRLKCALSFGRGIKEQGVRVKPHQTTLSLCDWWGRGNYFWIRGKLWCRVVTNKKKEHQGGFQRDAKHRKSTMKTILPSASRQLFILMLVVWNRVY